MLVVPWSIEATYLAIIFEVLKRLGGEFLGYEIRKGFLAAPEENHLQRWYLRQAAGGSPNRAKIGEVEQSVNNYRTFVQHARRIDHIDCASDADNSLAS